MDLIIDMDLHNLNYGAPTIEWWSSIIRRGAPQLRGIWHSIQLSQIKWNFIPQKCLTTIFHFLLVYSTSLQWRNNERYGVSNPQPHDCLFSRLFRHRSKKTSELRVTFLWGIHRWPVNSPHKGPVTRKMFPFHDVIMCTCLIHCWPRSTTNGVKMPVIWRQRYCARDTNLDGDDDLL